MTSKPYTDEVYVEKRKPKNPIKFNIQLNDEQKIAKIFKVTTVNDQGDELVAYVRENYKQSYLRSMMEEYGNSVAVEIDIADIPANVDIPR